MTDASIFSNENIKHLVIKIPLIFILFFLAYYAKTDYGILGIILTIFLYYFSSNKLLTLCGLIFIMFSYCYFSNSMPIQLYAILSFIFMWLFNGQKGSNAKWLFYIFYTLILNCKCFNFAVIVVPIITTDSFACVFVVVVPCGVD